MDVVYPVREGDNNEELRYSLRSLRNLPHNRVWIVGHKPDWVTGVEHIRGNFHRCKPTNVYQNLILAATHPGTPEEFVVFNDDFFVTEPISEVPVWYRSSLEDHIAMPVVQRQLTEWWGVSLTSTLSSLRDAGHEDPLSYELHVPFPVVKSWFAETLLKFWAIDQANPPQWRTLYGNEHRIGGVQAEDCKRMKRRGPIHRPFHSTDDYSWEYFAPLLRLLFPDPSPYELSCDRTTPADWDPCEWDWPRYESV